MPAGAIKVPQIIPLRPPHGNRKHVIDSKTEIDIRLASRDPDVHLYYTLNNKRPDPFQAYGEKFTRKFDYPFTLSPGKKTIKVMAMAADKSKESSVVTRTFIVHEGGKKDKDADDTTSSAAGLDVSLSQQFRHKLRLSSRESNKSGFAPSPPPPPPPTLFTKRAPIVVPKSNHGNSLKCLYCHSTVMNGQVYCTACGVQLPRLPLPGEDPTRLNTCPECRSELSPSVTVCHVCDTPLQCPQSLPTLIVQDACTNTKNIPDLIQCLYCGMYNDPRMSVCTTCDQALAKRSDRPSSLQLSGTQRETIMHPIAGSSYLMCGTCGRVNVSDARFCDWCGCKPSGSSVELLCQVCDSSNDWQARYCHKCGEMMKCPLRPDVESGGTLRKPKGVKVDHHQWVPVADIVVYHEDKEVTAWPDTQSCGTQTQGLFYPSEKTITVKKQVENWHRLVKKVSKDRLTNLLTYSPGKGLWRAQLDHIITHLKAHATSSHEFQDSIGYYQLGKLYSSSIEHDSTDSDATTLTLKLSFAIKGELDDYVTPYHNKTILRKQQQKQHEQYQQPAMKKTGGGNGSAVHSRVQSAEKRRRNINSPQITVEDHLLASELAFTGQGRPDIVTSLIDKGANSNAVDSSGLPILSLAASHGHVEAMNVLIEQGNANINAQARKSGNTPLHEAVSMGASRKAVIQSLLSHGANPTIKNKENLTPCELANKLGHKQLMLLFASQLGSSMLIRLHQQTAN